MVLPFLFELFTNTATNGPDSRLGLSPNKFGLLHKRRGEWVTENRSNK